MSVNKRNGVSAKRICVLAVSVSLAMVLSFLESLIPPFVAVPGIKIGLSNTVSLFLLYLVGAPAAIAVSFVRVCLSALLFGTAVSFIYSLSGAALSLFVMILFKRLGIFSKVGVSVLGGVFHNVGQIIAAILILKTTAIVVYLPVLIASGVVAGIAVGLIAGLVLKKAGPHILNDFWREQ